MELIKLLKGNNQKGSVGNFFTPSKSNPPAKNGEQWLQTYNTNPRMAPVTKMALDISTSRGSVYKEKRDGSTEEVRNHPFTKMLYAPNPLYNTTGSADLYLSQVYYLVRGESFAIIDRKTDGTPKSLWWIPPTWVLKTPYEGSDCYEVKQPDGGTFTVKTDDMFYRKNPNPMNPLGRGIGRVEQIGDEIETDEYMAKYVKKFFFNDATPNLVITAPNDTDGEQLKLAERKWYQKFRGFGNASKTAFLNWDAKITLLHTTAKDMDFIESRKFYRDLAMQHYGIPPEIMGNVENSNKATVVAAQDIYVKEVLEPQLKEFEESLTKQLLVQYKDSRNLIFRFDRLVIEDREWDLEVSNAGLKNGAITINEWRIKNGFPELPENIGNRLYVPTNVVTIDLDTGEPVNTEEPTESDKPDSDTIADNDSTDETIEDEGGESDEQGA